MIVTRTPFRVTLGGGGTDLPSFYGRYGGFIFAMGIDKYMYLMLNPPILDRKIRVQYSRSEIVDHADELQHDLAREALRAHGIEQAMEISSLADLPASVGLGSSSSYLVGLLTALREYRRVLAPPQDIAEEACRIELEVLRKPIGKQDQYMAAFGGLTVLDIAKDGTVSVRSARFQAATIFDFIANTHIYYTGVQRSATDILADQDTALREARTAADVAVADRLQRIKDIGYRTLEAIETENFDEFGRLLDAHWEQKRRMSPKISLGAVDELYETVRARFGVLGGKIIGAGGGGFLMLYCPSNHQPLMAFMERHSMPRLRYTIEFEGAKVVANVFNSQRVGVDHRARLEPRERP
jgi:D-glycero-alpha-D-manno-heptose-7-phosphate kinase